MELRMNKDINYYLNLPYTHELIRESNGEWFIRIKELPGCISQGETQEEALRMIDDALRGWLETEIEDGETIPEPRNDEEFSGKFVLRVSKSMHRKFVETASDESVSLNQWLVSVLSEAVGTAKTSKSRLKKSWAEEETDGLNWPGLSSNIKCALRDVSMDYECGALDEKIFSGWLRQNIDEICDNLNLEKSYDADYQISVLLQTLNDHSKKSPLIKLIKDVLDRYFEFQIENNDLKKKVKEKDDIQYAIQSMLNRETTTRTDQIDDSSNIEHSINEKFKNYHFVNELFNLKRE